MVYTINLSNYMPTYRAMIKSKFKYNALRRLRAFPMNVTEKLLDEYLRSEYQITLKYACHLIILNCSVEENKDDLIITLTNKNLDKLARAITYGTGRLSGSRILPFILNKV